MKKEEIPLGHEAITWQMQSVIAGDSDPATSVKIFDLSIYFCIFF